MGCFSHLISSKFVIGLSENNEFNVLILYSVTLLKGLTRAKEFSEYFLSSLSI